MIRNILKKIQAVMTFDRAAQYESVLGSLQTLSAIESVKIAAQLIADISSDENLTPKDLLKCLLSLDDEMQRVIDELNAKRLKVKIYNRSLGAEIDSLVCPYLRRLFMEYSRLIDAHHMQPEKIIDNSNELALLYCRAFNAASSMMLWRYYDDQIAPPMAWTIVHDLFKRAENSSVLYRRVRLYPNSKRLVDAAVLIANGLMLSTLQNESYSPAELNIISKLLTDWVRQVSFEKAYAKEKYQFYVNLNQDKGAERIRAFDRKADYRYWRTDFIVEKIAGHLAAINTKTVAEDDDIRTYASMRAMSKLFKKLNRDWSVVGYRRQRRSSFREKSSSKLIIANGLAEITKQLSSFQQTGGESWMPIYDLKVNSLDHKHMKQTKGLNLGFDEWVLIDRSESGFGVDLGREPSSWVEAGKLVGFQDPSNRDSYVIAEVKHVKRQRNGVYRAGLHLLSLQSLVIKLIKQDYTEIEVSDGYYVEEQITDKDLVKISCVWIPPTIGNSQLKSSVLLPINEYQKNRQFKIDINGEEKTIVLGRLMETQNEWVRASVAAIH